MNAMPGSMTNGWQQTAERWLTPVRKLVGVSLACLPADCEEAVFAESPKLCQMVNSVESCSAICRKTHAELRRCSTGKTEAQRTVCPNGMTLFAIPVDAGVGRTRLIEGGRVFSKPPSATQFQRVSSRLWPNSIRKQPANWVSSWNQIPAVGDAELDATIDLLRCVAGEISKLPGAPVDGMPGPLSPAVQRACEYVDANLNSRLNIATVARIACLSEDYFSKLFKRETGIAFTRYVAQQRVRWARTLLLARGKRISDVAYDCGFESVPNFNRTFRQIAGLSPGAFRASSSR